MNLKDSIEEIDSIVESYAEKEEANGGDVLPERARKAWSVVRDAAEKKRVYFVTAYDDGLFLLSVQPTRKAAEGFVERFEKEYPFYVLEVKEVPVGVQLDSFQDPFRLG